MIKNFPLLGCIVITLVLIEWIAICFFGFGGYGSRGGWYDFAYFFAAGKCWLAKQDPYNFETFSTAFRSVLPAAKPDPFPYPPMFAPFCMIFASIDWQYAMNFSILLNFIAAGCLAFIAVKAVLDAKAPRPASDMFLTRWLLPCIVMGLPFTIHQAWLGQVTLMAGVFIFGSWYLAQRNQTILAGVLLGMAFFKPQYVLLPAVYLILERRWKLLGVAIATSLLLAIYPLSLFGPISAMRSWLSALAQYQANMAANALGSENVMGLPSTLASLGIKVPSAFVLVLGGAILVVLLWKYKDYFCPDDLLPIIILIQFCLVYAKYVDLALLAPVFAAIWLHIAHRKKLWIGPAIALVALFIPRRLYTSFSIPVLLHFRSFVVLGLFIFLLVLSWQFVKSKQLRYVEEQP